MEKKRHAFLLALMLICSIAYAHQPRVVLGRESSPDSPILIEDPEVSKAYYGELKGGPAYYAIYAEKPFRFYANILTPAVEGYNRTDFSVEVSTGDKPFILLDGTNSAWELFYEEYAGDYYLKGPEERVGLPEGSYIIKVYSRDNTGRYSLAVGETESFSPGEALNALVAVPTIKQGFFGKTLMEAYMNTSGLVLIFIPAAIILVLLFLIVKVKKRRGKKH